MTVVRRFLVHEDVSGEYNDHLLGRIPYAFTAGPVTPDSEQDEVVLTECLVPAGFAKLVDETEPRDRPSFEPPELPDGVEEVSAGNLTDGSIPDVLARVAGDPVRAGEAKAQELDGKRRSSLLNDLDAIIAAAPAVTSTEQGAAE